MIFVGIDIGTTGLKAVALDRDGRLLRERAERYSTRLHGTGAEQDAEAWWKAACAALPAVVAGDVVGGVAVTCQAPTLVAVDDAGRPTGPALTWVDRRATKEAHEIEHLLGSKQRNPADPFFGTSKLLWARRHTDYLDNAEAVLGANGFLVRKLIGRCTLDESSAGMLQGWDGGFAPELTAAGVPVDLLPTAVPCTTTVGEVTAEAADASGLPRGARVVAGGIDSIGAALEAGVFTPDDPPVEMTGFSTVVLQAIPRGATVPGMIHTRHCLPHVDLALAAQNSTGSVVDWLRRMTGIDPSGASLPERRPGRILMVPSFAGDRTPTWNTHARGTLVGLDLSCEPSDLLLAAYEGTALALRECLEQMRPQDAQHRLRCIGGGAKSYDWLQIKADVLGHSVDVPECGHGAAVGAGLLAGLAVGHFTKIDQLRARTDASRMRVVADLDKHAAYTRRLESFTALRSAVDPFAHELVTDTEREHQ